MTATAACLPTANKEWGFFGTYATNFAADHTATTTAWTNFSDALSSFTSLTDRGIRDYLDSPAGRHWADDLSFIDGPHTRTAIAKHLEQRLARRSWRAMIERAERAFA